MNWVGELCDLYDKNSDKAGIMDGVNPVLLPLYHTTVAAQIEVTVDENGNFLNAQRVPEEEKETIIPVTDKSSSRTAGIEPHPLCDNLKYLAGDYAVYVSGKDCSRNHELYMEQLEKWAESPFSHKKVRAIYRYLLGNTLMGDLMKKGVLESDENGKADTGKKIQIVSQTEAFVRFRVESDTVLGEEAFLDETGRFAPECWKDRTLQDSYIAYCRSWKENMGLSYLTGEWTQISYLQPKKIRNEGDGAKLISANDETNYTFRGRFASKEEAFAIGYEDSQKAHNALKWILRKQGMNYNGMYLVTWESDSGEALDWQQDTETIRQEAEKAADNQDYEGDGWPEEEWEEEESYAGTGSEGAARFRKAVRGYGRNLSQSSRTIIMAVDAATKGRLAMVEFKAYQSARYLRSLEDWYRRCEWLHTKNGKEGRYNFYGMVSVRDAAELLYGTEQNGYFSLKGKEELYKEVAKRWMPCILERKEVPSDMVNLAVRRASSPVSFSSRFLWERILSLACSLVKQQYEKRYKEEWTMALDEKCTRRDYLYGRLLAVADRVEYRTFEKDDGRETNAKRYMNAFSQHPFRTWKILEEKLVPYFNQLKAPERLKYQALLDEIYELFPLENFEDDTALNGLYLIGFHNQSFALKNRNKRNEEA